VATGRSVALWVVKASTRVLLEGRGAERADAEELGGSEETKGEGEGCCELVTTARLAVACLPLALLPSYGGTGVGCIRPIEPYVIEPYVIEA
jgi:hypothetical protein